MALISVMALTRKESSFQLTGDECIVMVRQLLKVKPMELIACAIGADKPAIKSWLKGRSVPMAPSRRAIWYVYALTFRPDWLKDWQTVMTWGRFADAPDKPKQP